MLRLLSLIARLISERCNWRERGLVRFNGFPDSPRASAVKGPSRRWLLQFRAASAAELRARRVLGPACPAFDRPERSSAVVAELAAPGWLAALGTGRGDLPLLLGRGRRLRLGGVGGTEGDVRPPVVVADVLLALRALVEVGRRLGRGLAQGRVVLLRPLRGLVRLSTKRPGQGSLVGEHAAELRDLVEDRLLPRRGGRCERGLETAAADLALENELVTLLGALVLYVREGLHGPRPVSPLISVGRGVVDRTWS